MLSRAHPGPVVTVLWCGWPDGPPGPRAVEVCLSCQTGGLSSLGVPGVNETGRGVTGLWFRVRATPPGGCGQAGGGGLGAPPGLSGPPLGRPSLCASAWGEGPLPAGMGPPCRAAQTAGPRGEHGLCGSPPSCTRLPVSASQTHPPSRLPCSPGSGPRWPRKPGKRSVSSGSVSSPAGGCGRQWGRRGAAKHRAPGGSVDVRPVPPPRAVPARWPLSAALVVRPPSPASARAVR